MTFSHVILTLFFSKYFNIYHNFVFISEQILFILAQWSLEHSLLIDSESYYHNLHMTLTLNTVFLKNLNIHHFICEQNSIILTDNDPKDMTF